MNTVSNLLYSLLDILLPRHCLMCDNTLSVNERLICPSCLFSLHTVPISDYTDNIVVRRMWDKVDVRKGFSFTYYQKGSKSHNIFIAMKYQGRRDVCFSMGKATAQRPHSEDFFSDIDGIIPIPLSKQRLRHRGYNQAECIARGISHVSGIPLITNVLYRKKNNTTQTHMQGAEARYENVADIFAVHDSALLAGKHILMVDDIITTGATMMSAMTTILDSQPTCTFSVMSVGVTQRD